MKIKHITNSNKELAKLYISRAKLNVYAYLLERSGIRKNGK